MQLITGIIFVILFVVGVAWIFSIAHKKSKYGKSQKDKLNMAIAGVLCAISFLLFLVVPFGFTQIETGEIGVVKVWGEARETKTEGLHFVNIISTTVEVYDLRTQEITETLEAYSLDAQTMSATITVQYRLQADKAIDINRTYGTLSVLNERIKAIAIERTKVLLSSKSAMSLIETRDSLSGSVESSIKDAIVPYFVDIALVVINNISFNDAFEQAVEQKMIAEQEKLKAEYDKEKALIKAQEQLEVARKEAEAVIARAEGDAEALSIMKDAWAGLTPEVREAMLREKFYLKWNGVLPEVMGGDYSLIFPLGDSSSTGSGSGSN